MTNETLQTLKTRRSVRKYLPKQVEEDALQAILEAAGSSLTKVVKTGCFLSDMDDFAEFNQIYSTFFTGKPARSCVAVKSLPKGVLVEIEVIGEIEQKG